jgi:hypothetical protein
MKIECKAKDEEGNVLFEGLLNRKEVSFLLQYSINDLMSAGVLFNLDEPDEDDDNPAMRIRFPEGTLN